MAFDLKRYFVLLCLGSSVILNVFLWVFLVIRVAGLSEDVVLHYDALQGVDLLGPVRQFFILPLVGLVVIGVNFLLSAFSIKTNQLVAKILGSLAVLAQIILIVAAVLLMNINS